MLFCYIKKRNDGILETVKILFAKSFLIKLPLEL